MSELETVEISSVSIPQQCLLPPWPPLETIFLQPPPGGSFPISFRRVGSSPLLMLLLLSLFSAAGIVRKKQWCEMVPCLEDEGCDLLVNKSGWTCTQPGGRVKTTTVSWASRRGRDALKAPKSTLTNTKPFIFSGYFSTKSLILKAVDFKPGKIFDLLMMQMKKSSILIIYMMPFPPT